MTTRTVTSRRTLEHRMSIVAIASRGRHAVEGAPSSWSAVTTLCGITSEPGTHNILGSRPLGEEVECAACRTAALAIPFVHSITIGRRQIGRGAVKGSGMRYGAQWRCTCGANGYSNEAPSRGGTKSCETQAHLHLDAVQREQASAEEIRTDGLVHLMSEALLDACGTSPAGLGLSVAPETTPERITCPACRALLNRPAGRTVEQNRAEGYYDEFMTEHCRGCTSLGGHSTECPRYGRKVTVGLSAAGREKAAQIAADLGLTAEQVEQVILHTLTADATLVHPRYTEPGR